MDSKSFRRLFSYRQRVGWGRLNQKLLVEYRPAWNWRAMEGSDDCLKWSFRDLGNLERALDFTPGRRVAVQAGGNLGLFPKRLAEDFEVVHTFEPEPNLFACLKKNAPEKNIVAHQCALGRERTSIALSFERRDTSGRPAHEGLTHITGPGEDAAQILVDDLDLHACDLIYLDVEGYELNALQGATKTIDRFRPTIAVEINSNCNHYGVNDDDVRNWIRARDYSRVFALNSDEVFVPNERNQ